MPKPDTTKQWAIYRDGIIVSFCGTKKSAQEEIRSRSRNGLSAFDYTMKQIKVAK